ncbi:MAG TPA: glycosyltransferase family 39 protein [Candidatus Dormibacteraeota bacterium]
MAPSFLTATRPARGPVWAVIVAALVVFGHAPSFIHRLQDSDEAIYGSIAALMNVGGDLYSDGGVDNKPPGIFWVYATTFRLFGMYQMTAIHAVALLAVGATCLLVFLAGRQLASPRAGVLAAIFYAASTAAGNPQLLGTNTELLMMVPLTASVLLMLRRRWLWSGVLLVAAVAFKQVAAVNLLLFPAAIALLEPRETRLRASATFAGGLASGLVIGTAMLQLTGSLAGFWHWSVASLYGYASANWAPDMLWYRAQSSLPLFIVSTAAMWIAAIPLALRWNRLDASRRVIVVWLALSVVGSLAGGHLFWHYFVQVMAPLALVAALAIDRALESSIRLNVAALAGAGLALPLVGWTAFNVVADPLTYDVRTPIEHQLVASYVRDHTHPQDRVFVWGDWPALYVESDRLMASRFPGFLRGFARGSARPPRNWDTTADVWTDLQSDLTRHPPALIVDTAPAGWSDFRRYPMRNYPVVANLVEAKYRQVAVIDHVVIYRRNGP